MIEKMPKTGGKTQPVKNAAQTVKKPKLTPKQAKYVQGIAEGKPGYKAAMDAYDTTSLNVANVISVENLQKPTVREAVEFALGHHHIDAIKAVAPVKHALEFEGVTDRETLEMRLKGTDRYLKLLAMTEDKQTGSGNTFNFNINQGAKKFVDSE